jgi:hypothetical protein
MNADLLRDIALQDAANASSSTVTVRGRVELGAAIPGLGRCVRREPSEDDELRALADALEWSYGFAQPGAGGRVRRASPSAGALYPTEALAVAHAGGAWQLLFYSFERHCFLQRVPDAGAGALARELGLERDQGAVFFASVLWRTLQAYGMRGYRYCLVDAANVASNFAEVLSDCGWAAEAVGPEHFARVESAFGLPASIPVLLGIVHRRAGRAAPPRPAVGAPPAPRRAFSEDVPAFNPQLRRVLNVVVRGRKHCAGSELRIVSHTRGARERFAWSLARHSAADFACETLAPEVLETLLAFVRGYLADDAAAHGSPLAVAVLRAAGPAAFAGDYVMLGARGAERRPLAAADRRRAGLARTFFQGQIPAEHAAVLAVVGIPELDAHTATHGAFEQACVRAGFLVADLYRFAAMRGLGTTAIGGFSDGAVAGLLGTRTFHPLIVQAFGTEIVGATKYDAVFSGVVAPAPGRENA